MASPARPETKTVLLPSNLSPSSPQPSPPFRMEERARGRDLSLAPSLRDAGARAGEQATAVQGALPGQSSEFEDEDEDEDDGGIRHWNVELRITPALHFS